MSENEAPYTARAQPTDGDGNLIVAYSGGKDSTACLLWALDTGFPVRVLFSDTGNEPPDTPEYMDYIQERLGVMIERVPRYQEWHGFFGQVERRGMWPMPGRCEVSKACKINNFARYLRETGYHDSDLIILGQRAEESSRRANLHQFTPRSSYHNGLAVYRPILDWSTSDVFAFLAEHDVDPHPAYAKGRHRIGCVWCVHSTLEELIIDERLYPERCARLRELRESMGLSSIPAGIEQATFETAEDSHE
jgi:3'-phosphoadenosine 5'-phosphosulfate sulfotransferase (PAPS reductase)/FAD synthetase